MCAKIISVIVPVYNSENTIATCLKSIVDNYFDGMEVLIYDDGSTDESLAIVKSFQQEFSFLNVYSSDQNHGAGFARNYLLGKVTGRFVAFLDADDYWFPKTIKKKIDIMIKGDIDILSSAYQIYDENKNLLGTRVPPKNVGFFKIHFANWLPTSFTIVRSSLKGAKNMPLIRTRQDYAYWIKIFSNNKKLKFLRWTYASGIYKRAGSGLSSNRFKNIKNNFRMFRDSLGYNLFLSALCVLLNVIVRIFRV